MKPFVKPIYVTQPLLPDLGVFNKELSDTWRYHWFTNQGPKVKKLENILATRLKVQNLLLFNNGTIALLAAIKSLNLSGEVITTPFTFPATPHVLTWNNVTPVFCDIDPYTMNIDVNKIEKMITKKTSAILAVHVFGIPCDVEKIQQIAKKHNLKVIYDAAHAFEVEINGSGIGNLGDITMFSFHATKLFHTAEGGALSFKNKLLKNQLYLLQNFGIANELEVRLPGINGKMNEIQAILGLAVLRTIKRERIRRKKIKKLYIKFLKETAGIRFYEDKLHIKSSYQYLPIRINEKEFGRSRNYVYKKLKEYNIFTRRYFYPLCSEYPYYKILRSSSPKNLPVAHQVVQEVLCLPFYGNLSDADVEKICTILQSLQE